MVASSLRDSENGLIDCPAAVPRGKVLPVAVIYGANASGKSNFINAIRHMQLAVLHSHSRGEPGQNILRRPFALDPNCKREPTTASIDFVMNGIRYHYGFEASDNAFSSEWLYIFPNDRRQVLFERKNGKYRFGRNLKGRNKVISDLTRDNSLFLSAAAQNDHAQLSLVSEYFRSFIIDSNISIPGGIISRELSGSELDRRILDFLSKAGVGVIGYRKREHESSTEIQELRVELSNAIRKAMKGKIDSLDFDFTNFEFELGHQGQKGEIVYLELDQESAGTRRLLILLDHVFSAIDEGATILVDELDASLHTQACEQLLALFSSNSMNPKGAQIVATTHDTNLLNSSLLRRDQIWFTEKDSQGATHVYPLTDIRTRKGDNIEKGYLQGRFGAVPFSGQLSVKAEGM